MKYFIENSILDPIFNHKWLEFKYKLNRDLEDEPKDLSFRYKELYFSEKYQSKNDYLNARYNSLLRTYNYAKAYDYLKNIGGGFSHYSGICYKHVCVKRENTFLRRLFSFNGPMDHFKGYNTSFILYVDRRFFGEKDFIHTTPMQRLENDYKGNSLNINNLFIRNLDSYDNSLPSRIQASNVTIHFYSDYRVKGIYVDELIYNWSNKNNFGGPRFMHLKNVEADINKDSYDLKDTYYLINLSWFTPGGDKCFNLKPKKFYENDLDMDIFNPDTSKIFRNNTDKVVFFSLPSNDDYIDVAEEEWKK